MRIKSLFSYWTNQAFFPGAIMKERYAAFKSLLDADKQAHEHMAQLEEIYHDQLRVDVCVIEKKYHLLSDAVRRVVSSLNRMHPYRYAELDEFFRKIDAYARHGFSHAAGSAEPPFCLPLTGLSDSMGPLAGEKALNLAMLGKRLQIPIPDGFVITTHAFNRFIGHNWLVPAVNDFLCSLDITDMEALCRRSEQLTDLILQSIVPSDVAEQILDTFDTVFRTGDRPARVAVRSSAVGEDSTASFAGQYRSILNVGRSGLLDAYKAVLASKYSPEALVYRINYGLADMEAAMAVLVVEMIEALASGVMYTRALDEGAADMLEIHSVFGLGELLVQGAVAPDRFTVRKQVEPEIAEKRVAEKKYRMVADPAGDTRVEPLADKPLPPVSIEDATVLTLARWGMKIEAEARGPRDVEWCVDRDKQVRLLQSRPLPTGGETSAGPECRLEEIPNRVLVSRAERAASGAASGQVYVALNDSDTADFPDKAVLVARTASARYVQMMEKISAVVTETGSAAGHFASVAREFGIPTIVNARGAANILENGQTVTVYADQGVVYEGIVSSSLIQPCVRKRPLADSPLRRKLDYIMAFVSPLRLIDPQAEAFAPGGCRSLHDIIRFAHEAGTREMFSIGDRAFGKSLGAKKLETDIPMRIYLMDVGGGWPERFAEKKTVSPEQILCRPFEAVWQGLSHPGIQWGAFSHFNWEEYDRIVMSGGIISADSAQLASYAVLSDDYLNLNLKFGYHFVILDTLCTDKPEDNHILFRFNGGGGDDQGRSLRAAFLQQVLQRLEFQVTRTSDLVDARFSEAPPDILKDKLDQLGRLLGATRLMDMYLGEADPVERYVDAFFAGRYHFATVAMDP